jgi:hypothetical protein
LTITYDQLAIYLAETGNERASSGAWQEFRRVL